MTWDGHTFLLFASEFDSCEGEFRCWFGIVTRDWREAGGPSQRCVGGLPLIDLSGTLECPVSDGVSVT